MKLTKIGITPLLLACCVFVMAYPAAYGEGEAQHLIQAAEGGDAEAQAKLAWISFELKDMASVHKWLQMAVKQEHPAALCMAGELCVATGDDKQAMKYFNAAAKKGMPWRCIAWLAKSFFMSTILWTRFARVFMMRPASRLS